MITYHQHSHNSFIRIIKHGLLYYIVVSHVINTVMTALLECYEFSVSASDYKRIQNSRFNKLPIYAYCITHIDTFKLDICDCLSENPPSSHLLVFREIPF